MEIVLKYFSDFTPVQLQQLAALEELYKDWNQKINVISRKDMEGLYEKHVLHSLSIAAVFRFDPGMEIIDIGTGGGFPGIPLAIFFPEVKFLLVDSIGKKLKVVEAVANAIGLQNVTVHHSRVEEIKNRKTARSGSGFDFAVSRAVAPLKDLWKWSRPLLRSRIPIAIGTEAGTTKFSRETHQTSPVTHSPGLICLKGGDLAKEIQESGTRPRQVEIYQLFPEPFFRDKYILYVQR